VSRARSPGRGRFASGQVPDGTGDAGWALACPRCRADLGPLPLRLPRPAGEVGRRPPEPKPRSAPPVCTACGLATSWRGDILDAVLPERAALLDRFEREYDRVRHAEGRGCADPAAIMRLPYVARGDPFEREWRIRARTWTVFRNRILPELGSPPHRVLDLGAGTGWLAGRLASAGWRSLAIDLRTDDRDGLGAARHRDGDVASGGWLPRLRAEFDRLPLPDESARVVVFNAAFHYAADLSKTVDECVRVLEPGGAIVIMDSPIYSREESGRRMVEARKQEYARRFGFASDALASREFLVDGELPALSAARLDWSVVQPWYGLAWSLRPLRRALSGGREPARFAILIGRVRSGRVL